MARHQIFVFTFIEAASHRCNPAPVPRGIRKHPHKAIWNRHLSSADSRHRQKATAAVRPQNLAGQFWNNAYCHWFEIGLLAIAGNRCDGWEHMIRYIFSSLLCFSAKYETQFSKKAEKVERDFAQAGESQF
jgi:hypothetical protein